MNYKLIFNTLGKTLIILSLIMLFPIIVGLIYGENIIFSFVIPATSILIIGVILSLIKPSKDQLFAKEGFVIVATSWILISLIGAIPFVLDGCIPNFVDAFFESASGFTTTGASIVSDVEVLPYSILFWRAMTHFIGGMGVLVFVLAILPKSSEGSMHILKAESPGPSVSKLVAKMKNTTLILYGIYVVLTIIETFLLYFGGMPVFDSITHALATAGTGGFGIKNNSIAYYNSAYIEMVIAVFMFLFGVNFNIYYLILTGRVIKALKSEEFLVFVSILTVATLSIAFNILSDVNNFWTALRYSFFQVASISSTTGFASTNFDTWPTLSKCILLFLMAMGAMGGSTGGGLKVSRIIILMKSAFANLKQAISPHLVTSVKLEGQQLDKSVVSNTRSHFTYWITFLVITTLLISIENNFDFLTNFSAALSCIGNIGPGFNFVGPTCNFAGYSAFAKILLSLNMIAGRLELFPILVLVFPKTWKK